jgi:hypothetical protein
MISDYQISLMEHSLGSKDPKKWHRNHFMASLGHTDLPDLRILVELGMMVEIPAPSFCDSESILFRVTDAGKQFLQISQSAVKGISRWRKSTS